MSQTTLLDEPAVVPKVMPLTRPPATLSPEYRGEGVRHTGQARGTRRDTAQQEPLPPHLEQDTDGESVGLGMYGGPVAVRKSGPCKSD